MANVNRKSDLVTWSPAFVEQIRTFNEGKKFNLTVFTKFLKNWILTYIALKDKQ